MPATLTASEEYTLTVQGPAAGDPRTAASVRQMGQPLLNRSLWTWRRTQDLLGSFCPVGGAAPVAIMSIDTSTNRITLEGHGLASNDPVRVYLATGATVPGGLSVIRLYYTRYIDADTIELSESAGPGSAVDITSGGSGAIYLVKVTDPLGKIMVPLAGGIGGKTLRSMMVDIAWVDKVNTFTAANTFSNDATFSKAAVISYELIVAPGASVRMSAPTTHTMSGATLAVNLTTTFQHDFSGSPGTAVTVTLNTSTGAAPSAYEYKRLRYSINGGHNVVFKSEGVSGSIMTFSSGFTHSGELWVWFDGTDWKGGHYSSTGTSTPGVAWF